MGKELNGESGRRYRFRYNDENYYLFVFEGGLEITTPNENDFSRAETRSYLEAFCMLSILAIKHGVHLRKIEEIADHVDITKKTVMSNIAQSIHAFLG